MADPFDPFAREREARPVARRSQPDSNPSSESRSGVVITGIDIPFWDLVMLTVKWTLAAIPAAIIIVFLVFIVAGALGAVASIFQPFRP